MEVFYLQVFDLGQTLGNGRDASCFKHLADYVDYDRVDFAQSHVARQSLNHAHAIKLR
jgi:hypothetical protein